MNLLTLLRTNKYTQKQMEFLLSWPAGKASRMVRELEKRGYIVVNRRYKYAGSMSRPYSINAQKLYKTTLYRSK